MDELQELLQEFVAESLDLVARIQSDLKAFGKDGDITEQFNNILRGLHTIKGGTSMFQLDELTKKSHKLESYLEKFKGNPAQLSAKQIQSVARYVDSIQSKLEEVAAPPAQEASAVPDEPQVQGNTAVGTSNLPPQIVDTARQEITNPPRAASKSSHHDFIRIPIERLEKSMDIITEIFLIRNQMSFLVDSMLRKRGLGDSFLTDWETLDNSLRKGIGELEQVAMSMRMMPLKNLFQRMEKTVRTYQESSTKLIEFVTRGEETELDKKILDYLAEPLIHLIRNAMDHGIEDPELRRQHGKSEAGTISLAAEVRGNEVLITITDDGKGMDHESVLASAIKKGLSTDHVQTKEQALDLIFLPGFSTAESVSDISGRGVGMDAVRNFVESIGGSIHLQTALGKGSTFTLTLPLGMSLIPAILARINNQTYAISSNEVLETMRCPRENILHSGDGVFLDYKGKVIPCYFLSAALSRHDSEEFLHIEEPRLSVCIIRTAEGFAGLIVNEFIMNTEIATKPLPKYSPKITYITGASILATGEPVFVLSMRRLHQRLKRLDGQKTNITEDNTHAAA